MEEHGIFHLLLNYLRELIFHSEILLLHMVLHNLYKTFLHYYVFLISPLINVRLLRIKSGHVPQLRGRGGRIKLKLTGTIAGPKICVHSKFQLKQMKKCKVMAVKPKL